MRPARRPPGRASAPYMLVALLAFAAVVVALLTQHVGGLQPCPWCVLQRLIFVALGLAALGAVLVRGPALRRAIGALLALPLALAGLAAALWQHFVASRSSSCNLTLADRIVGATGLDRLVPDAFAATANCADAAVRLLGVPYELWSAATFAALAALLAWAAWLRRR